MYAFRSCMKNRKDVSKTNGHIVINVFRINVSSKKILLEQLSGG